MCKERIMTEPVKDVVDARQGTTGHNVRYVLIGGIVLALVAMFVMLGWHPSGLPH
jgi:hypothetical protein